MNIKLRYLILGAVVLVFGTLVTVVLGIAVLANQAEAKFESVGASIPTREDIAAEWASFGRQVNNGMVDADDPEFHQFVRDLRQMYCGLAATVDTAEDYETENVLISLQAVVENGIYNQSGLTEFGREALDHECPDQAARLN